MRKLERSWSLPVLTVTDLVTLKVNASSLISNLSKIKTTSLHYRKIFTLTKIRTVNSLTDNNVLKASKKLQSVRRPTCTKLRCLKSKTLYRLKSLH